MKPLSFRAVNLGAGMATALIGKMLAELGVQTSRSTHADSLIELRYPAHRFWCDGIEPLELADVEQALSQADICIVGGETVDDGSPAIDVEQLRSRYPEMIILDVAGLADRSLRQWPVDDLLAQAHTGLCFEQYSQRPIHFALPLPTYGAVLQGVIAILAALIDRERTGWGSFVSTSLEQGVATFVPHLWLCGEDANEQLGSFAPKDVSHLIFECKGGDYIHFVLGVPGALARLYKLLGISEAVDENDRGLANFSNDPRRVYADTVLLAPYIACFGRDELLALLWDNGIAAEPVLAPGECWDQEQVAANGILKRDAFSTRGVGSPIRFRSDVEYELDKANMPISRAPSKSPLEGFRVLDFGNFIAGPYASRLLADLGADVIKVESVDGDFSRSLGRMTFVSNLGKRSIALDAKSEDGRQIILDLCKTADVFHHNLRVGATDRLGLSEKVLRSVNPELIVAQTSAYGLSGPKKTNSGFDMVMQALCGHELRAGGKDNPPLWYRSPIIDYATAALSAIGIMTALLAQMRGTAVRSVETSLLDGGLFLLSECVQYRDGTFEGATVQNYEQTGFHPAERIYQSKDGWLAVAARTDDMAQAFAHALNLKLGARSRWGDTEGVLISQAIGSMKIDSLCEVLAEARVWHARCSIDGSYLPEGQGRIATYPTELIDDLHFGQVRCAASPLFSRADRETIERTYNTVPSVGEHSREILVELGYDAARIDALIDGRSVTSNSCGSIR